MGFIWFFFFFLVGLLGCHLICLWILFDLLVYLVSWYFQWFVLGLSLFSICIFVCGFGMQIVFDKMFLWTIYKLWNNKWENIHLKKMRTYHNICIWAWTWFWGCATFDLAMGIRNDSWFGGGVERFCCGRCTGLAIMN